MSDVAKLYEGLSDKGRSALDKFQKEGVKHCSSMSYSAMSYMCFGYLIAQGLDKNEATKATVVAERKNFWQK